MLLLLGIAAVTFADTVEKPEMCQRCGMSRTLFPEARVVITYQEGTEAGVCSIHCAAEHLRKNGGKQVKSIMVADYRTRELTDAGTATWVVGGKRSGVMTGLPKWAFARRDDAENFVREKGGEIQDFQRVLDLADQETQEADCCKHKHAGGQMLFNPAFGDDIYHVHPAGMWMANYKYMHMVQKGLANGSTDVPAQNATPVGNRPFGFMMIPTRMTMDMHMVMLMYGVSDRFALMGMGSYLDNEMEMVMNMGAGNVPDRPMRTSGLGDTELRGIYRINDYLTGSLGIGIPTGDIDQSMAVMNQTFRAPYDMQLGSGTVDLKPALTYTALSSDLKWSWGGQAMYTYHLDRNDNGYSLGDSAKVTGWLQRALGPAVGWFRLAYNYTGRIKGRDAEIDKLLDPVTGAPTPDADPANYGGHRIDGFLGASYTMGPLSLGVEGGIPLYQYLNGLQLKNDWYLTAGIQGMF
jgi:nitrous oxide reductase accessory protein NosL